MEEKLLFKKMQEGDWDAFRIFFKRYMEQLYLYTIGFVKNREDAEDIVQEVFIALWVNRNKISRIDSMHAYLFRAVKNACIDFKLHAHVEQKYRAEMAARWQEAVEESDVPEELYRRLHAALDTLPPKCLEIFTMGCVDGMSYKEIAEMTGVSVNTVKTQMKIAYKKMREELGEENTILLFALLSLLPVT